MLTAEGANGEVTPRPCLTSPRAYFRPPSHPGSPPVVKVGRPSFLLQRRAMGSALRDVPCPARGSGQQTRLPPAQDRHGCGLVRFLIRM